MARKTFGNARIEAAAHAGTYAADVAEDVTKAQYLYVRASNNSVDMTKFQDDAITSTLGAAWNTVNSNGTQAQKDKLEDKLGVNLDFNDIKQAYGDILSDLDDQFTEDRIITEWSIDIAAITGSGSLFSAHARSVMESKDPTGAADVFGARDKIVVSAENDAGDQVPIAKELTLSIQEHGNNAVTSLVSHSGATAIRFILEQQQ